MKSNRRRLTITIAMILLLALSGAISLIKADSGNCGNQTFTLPFTDVMGNGFFCQIAAAYFSGLTNGTSPTTYSPSNPVTREQMAAFITRTQDSALRRGSRRAALQQWWTPTSTDGLGLTTVGHAPEQVASDGADLWVANNDSFTVSRVRASDGKVLGTWTGAVNAKGVLVAAGRVFVTGHNGSGKLYEIDPAQPAGAVTILTSALGDSPRGLAFDGSRIWTANHGSGSPGSGSVSIVTLNPVNVTTVTTGFSHLAGILYDGANIWVVDNGNNKLQKLDANGNILQTIITSQSPLFAVFDGTNIWVPNFNSSSLMVVRASSGTVLATLTGNGLNNPYQAAFDGERILVTNYAGQSVSLWKAADLTPLGSFNIGSKPLGACSDGLNFWITLNLNPGQLVRF